MTSLKIWEAPFSQTEESPILFELPNCSICMQRLQKNLVYLYCGHVFHEKCIHACLATLRKECPECKKCIDPRQYKDMGKLYFNLQAKSENTFKGNQKLGAIWISEQKKRLQTRLFMCEKENLELKDSKKNYTLNMDLATKKIMNLEDDIRSLEQCNLMLENERQAQERKIRSLQIETTQLKKTNDMHKQKDNTNHTKEREGIFTNNLSKGSHPLFDAAQGLRIENKQLQRNFNLLEGKMRDTQSSYEYCKSKLNLFKQIAEKQQQSKKPSFTNRLQHEVNALKGRKQTQPNQKPQSLSRSNGDEQEEQEVVVNKKVKKPRKKRAQTSLPQSFKPSL